ncbi:MAG: hypothetical protein HKL95_05280 [Phycisphaerae bacterium]|nr:hypothetical protein [Phycisphaerae bacterium]
MKNDKASPIKLAWRIGYLWYESPAEFRRLLTFLERHRGVVDEVALFETITHHLYVPLEIFAPRAALIGNRVRALKKAGFSNIGINVLTTIGHMDEAWDYNVPLPFQPMVGHDGKTSKGCACPNTPELRRYVRAKYELVARASPDFIWVDDDIRMHQHSVAYACFCPRCLAIFNQAMSSHYSRESLVAALNDPAQGTCRRAWAGQNIATIENLLSEVAKAVHSVNPGITTGLMTAGPGWSTYSGQAFDRWFPALQATKARPGGGFYSDEHPFGAINKSLEVGRQRAALPPSVTDCQYELENFPYQSLLKSTATVMNECTLAFAVGLNGIAFNAIGMSGGGDLAEFDAIPQRAAVLRPHWERLVKHAAGLPTTGLWPAWSPSLMACRSLRPGEDWFAADQRYDISRSSILAQIGLPLAVDRSGSATVLAGHVAEGFDTAELQEMLAGGVLMDSTALQVLAQRGLDHLTGVRVTRRLDNGVWERLTRDPLNGRHGAEVRDARIEFWGDASGAADELVPTEKGVRILANMENYESKHQGRCMTAYQNALGGRVVVMGYAPWMFLHSIAKRRQMQNVADWITRGKLPVRIVETVSLVPLVRMSAARDRGVVVLLNAGLDLIERATVQIRAPNVSVHLCTAGSTRRLPSHTIRGGVAIRLEGIAPWTTAVLLLGGL